MKRELTNTETGILTIRSYSKDLTKKPGVYKMLDANKNILYIGKAKNLKKMAKQLIQSGGMQPDWDFLESLAGVGHKTASVVMSQWYGYPAFPIDTHIHRLAARWGLSRAKNVEMTERDLKRLWPEDEWNRKHLQIIFFGREHCPARGHNLDRCLICKWAASKKRKKEEN